METAMYVLGAFAAIAGTVAGVMFSISHRDTGIWLSCATVVFLVVGGFCWIQEKVWTADRDSQQPDSSEALRHQLVYELDDPIRRAVLILWLTKAIEFEALCPLGGTVMVNPGSASIFEGLVFKFADADSRKSILLLKDSPRVACYTIDLTFKEQSVKRQTFALSSTRIVKVGVPIPLWATNGRPFRILRDLHQSSISVSLSKNLVARTKKIELIVNGWAVFQKDVVASEWRSDGESSTLLSDAATADHPPRAIFDLDLRSTVLERYPSLAGPVGPLESADIVFQTVKD